jgi:hypothetical protein
MTTKNKNECANGHQYYEPECLDCVRDAEIQRDESKTMKTTIEKKEGHTPRSWTASEIKYALARKQDDADFIVRACNSHERLVEALTRISKKFQGNGYHRPLTSEDEKAVSETR